MAPNQALLDYIHTELQKGLSKETIVKILLDSHYTQQQVDEAFSFIDVAEPSIPVTPVLPPKTSRNLLIPFIIFAGLIVVGGALAYGLITRPKETTLTTLESPLPSSEAIVEGCDTAHDIGYIKGFSSQDINDNTDLPVEIPAECAQQHDQGYEEGKKAAELQFAQSFDTKRKDDLTAISNGVVKYATENAGKAPTGITATAQEIGTQKLNIIPLVSQYMEVPFPFDPVTGSEENTGYTIYKSAEGRIVLEAESSVDPTKKITVTK